MEIARAGFADNKADALHKVRVFLLPVLSGISCAIQASIKHTHHILVAKLAIFDGDLNVHKPNGLGVEICSLYVRAKYAIPFTRCLVACALAYDIAQAI